MSRRRCKRWKWVEMSQSEVASPVYERAASSFARANIATKIPASIHDFTSKRTLMRDEDDVFYDGTGANREERAMRTKKCARTGARAVNRSEREPLFHTPKWCLTETFQWRSIADAFVEPPWLTFKRLTVGSRAVSINSHVHVRAARRRSFRTGPHYNIGVTRRTHAPNFAPDTKRLKLGTPADKRSVRLAAINFFFVHLFVSLPSASSIPKSFWEASLIMPSRLGILSFPTASHQNPKRMRVFDVSTSISHHQFPHASLSFNRHSPYKTT